MKLNKFFPFALIFFFFNSLGLPHGLTYTALLSPLFYAWIILKQKSEPLLPFLLIMTPFVIIHLINHVEIKDYFITLVNLISIYVFCFAFYVFLKTSSDKERIFTRLLYINFFLCLIAIPIYFTSYYKIFWIEQFLTQGIDEYKRLKMFTYEASYYSLLFLPLFFFFLLQILFKQNQIRILPLLTMILLPLILSFSLGVLSAIFLSVLITYLVYWGRLMKKRKVISLLFAGAAGLVFGSVFLYIFYPDNTLFIRIQNIFSGHDSSAKGRTYEAFFLAREIIALKSSFFGVGLGQIKIIGSDIIRDYYQYPADYAITIPNAAAETLAIFGWLGLLIRLFLEIFFFFLTKVWTNYFRMLLFLFMFIYQFTGSFITDLAEYVIWILAFTNTFPQFDVNPSHRFDKNNRLQ